MWAVTAAIVLRIQCISPHIALQFSLSLELCSYTVCSMTLNITRERTASHRQAGQAHAACALHHQKAIHKAWFVHVGSQKTLI